MSNQESKPKRKVFLSFLGNTTYQECVYIDKKRPTENNKVVKFVQEALCDLYCKDWTADDQIIICVTDGNDGSKAKNWDGEQGLENRLKALDLMTPAKHLMISEGFTEIGNNAIFAEIFKNLNNGDEVYFDITNAFRSIPLFGMVLMDYARFLKKDFTIAEVFYGAFEAMTYPNGNPIRGFEAKNAAKPEEKYVNIVHLTEMLELQNWTTAANDFIIHGNAERLSQLIKPANTELAQQLLDLTNAILTCRGSKIVKDLDIDKLKQALIAESEKSNIQTQLLPLIEKINEKIAPFQNGAVQNGFAAVQWCIQHGWVQQGYTFLQETIISYILVQINQESDINIYKKREGVRLILNDISENNWKPEKVDTNTATATQNFRKALDNSRKTKFGQVKSIFKKLSGTDGLRNDINHCGYSNDAKTDETLRSELNNLYRNVKSNLF